MSTFSHEFHLRFVVDKLNEYIPIDSFFIPGSSYDLIKFYDFLPAALMLLVVGAVISYKVLQCFKKPSSKQENKYQNYLDNNSKEFYHFLDLHIHHQYKVGKIKLMLIASILSIFFLIPFYIVSVTPSKIDVKSTDEAIVSYWGGFSKTIKRTSYDGFHLKFSIAIKKARYGGRVLDNSLNGCELVFYKGKENAGDLRVLTYFLNNQECYKVSKTSPLMNEKFIEIGNKIKNREYE